MKALKYFRAKEPSFADLLDYAAVIDNGLMLLKSGALMASWRYKGDDTASLTFDELASRSSQINNALGRLGSGWMSQHDVFRIKSKKYPDKSSCFFPDPVTAAIDQERREVYQSGTHHENIHVVTLTYLPPSVGNAKTSALMVDNDESFDLLGVGGKNIEHFNNRCQQFESAMGVVCKMTRLKGKKIVTDIYGTEEIYDDQLRFIQNCISGDNHPMALPSIPMYMDKVLGGQEFIPGLIPVIGEKYIGVVGIDGFPQSSCPGILEGLDQLQFEYRWSSRFIYEDPFQATKQLHKYRKQWQQKKRGFIAQMTQNYNAPVDQYAAQMESETEGSIAQASSGGVLFGYYTSVIVILTPDQDEIKPGCETIRNLLNNQGFNGRIEGVNAIEAYLGSLPGHSSENVRRPVIHTLNLADMLPINSLWPGHEFCPSPYFPQQSPPLLYTSTTGNTPFRLNFHVQDLGHTLIFGPTGAGKSTLLAVLAAQWRKYRDANVFIFEKGYSMYPLCSAIEGASHFDIGGDGHPVQFCPLNDIKTDTDQVWAEEWLINALKLQNIVITPDRRAAVRSALHQHRENADQSLHDFVDNLQDREMSLGLERYTINNHQPTAILDASEDNFETSSFNVFELDHLMEMGEDMILPVLTYIFRVIEKKLTGQPSVIFLDEAWIVLGHETFRDKLREWLKTLRKMNCSVVLSTQSIADASNTSIFDSINESCPTKIYLPNSSAKDESSTKLYQKLGLNEREIDLISRATPKKEYYFRNPEGRRLFNLQLGPLAMALAGATGKNDLAQIRNLQKHHGKDWLNYWLSEQGASL